MGLQVCFLGVFFLLSFAAYSQWKENPIEIHSVMPGDTATSKPVIVTDGNQGAIIAWIDRRGMDPGIYAQRLDAATKTKQWQPGGVKIQSTPELPGEEIAAVSDGAGGAIVAWIDGSQANHVTRAQRINGSGQTLWGSGAIVCSAPHSRKELRMVTDGAGGAIVCWADSRKNGNAQYPCELYAQRVMTDGTLAWPNDGVLLWECLPDPQNPAANRTALVADGSGGAWALLWTGSASRQSILQRVDQNGSILTPGGIVVLAGGGNEGSAIAADGTGGVYVVSVGPPLRLVHRVDANGVELWEKEVFQGLGGGTIPVVVTRTDGHAVIVAEGSEMRAQRVDPAGNKLWGATGYFVSAAVKSSMFPYYRVVLEAANNGVYILSKYPQRMSASASKTWKAFQSNEWFGEVAIDGPPGTPIVAWYEPNVKKIFARFASAMPQPFPWWFADWWTNWWINWIIVLLILPVLVVSAYMIRRRRRLATEAGIFP